MSYHGSNEESPITESIAKRFQDRLYAYVRMQAAARPPANSGLLGSADQADVIEQVVSILEVSCANTVGQRARSAKAKEYKILTDLRAGHEADGSAA